MMNLMMNLMLNLIAHFSSTMGAVDAKLLSCWAELTALIWISSSASP